MDNKLSELSNPYGYEYVTAGRGHVVMSRTLPPVDMCEVKPLYSQEYVSALKHEAAVNWEAAASLAEESEELKKRIAELEAKLDVRDFSAEMLARADDSDNSLPDDMRAGMRTAAAFANVFIELREVQHG